MTIVFSLFLLASKENNIKKRKASTKVAGFHLSLNLKCLNIDFIILSQILNIMILKIKSYESHKNKI